LKVNSIILPRAWLVPWEGSTWAPADPGYNHFDALDTKTRKVRS